MTIDLTAGVRVLVKQPLPPVFRVEPPSTRRSVVVPMRGPAGPPGPAGSGASFAHHQSAAAATWTVIHSLGAHLMPVLLLDDDPDRPVYTDTETPDVNTTVLSFPSPVTGWAYFTN